MAQSVVGLDIGSSGIRAAEFTIGRRSLSLRKFASVPLPPGAIRAGVVADVDAVVDALATLWSEGKFGTKDVVLALANASILVRQMDLDWMPAADFRNALRYQVEDALPIPVDDANLDYHLLEDLDVEGEGGETRRIARVLLVAASREMVDGFVEAVHQAGLRPLSVDIIPFALVRAIWAADPDPAAPAEAIVDIGFDTVKVVVHQGGQPRYVRIIPGAGGDGITRALQDRYSWSWDDAERTKIKAGLPGHADLDGAMPDTEGFEHPAQRLILSEVETLVAEIRTTLEYFRSATQVPAALSQVLLAGSGSQLGGLEELLATRLGVPVKSLSVVDRINMPRRLMLSAEDERALVIPAGLCTGVAV